ncbi:rhomboid family intramembrane serine protease [Halovivax gelatinilyticus]|uniref:rhomboid family intramembrane serine protease n=1 Tax=Halovivax gelatinilyticus TaxID=2961597 RepID=UPI0020CA9667|nr:rhomboid family intramembrane serine protease [Halovivax gelatinilyticus]
MQRLAQAGMLVGVVALFACSLYAMYRVDRKRHWLAPLRSRLYLGVPWGSLVVVGFVLCVYLFVQDGWTSWSEPVTIPFRAWSYQYPLGMLTASFSHADASHLIGNLTGALVVAPIAEYAWGHNPRETGERTLPYVPTDPRVRAFVVFPGAVLAIGLVTSLFAVGPVIGFSGVVYAFAGFAIVRYPIATLVGVLGAHGALATTVRAVQHPIVWTEPTASPASTPSWATIAIQGHALGFFVGFLLGLALLRYRRTLPDPLHLWLAIVLFAFSKSLWAIYWYGPEGVYYLFRGPGVLVIVALSIVVTLAVVASDRPLLPTRSSADDAGVRAHDTNEASRSTATDGSNDSENATGPVVLADITPPTDTPEVEQRELPSRRSTGPGQRTDIEPPDDRDDLPVDTPMVDEPSGGADPGADQTPFVDRLGRTLALDRLSRRGTALLVVLLVVAAITGPAVLVNAFAFDASDTDSTLTVEDYHVTYDERVENQLVSIAPIEALGVGEAVTASGVIVWSDDRNVWTDAISANRLAFYGEQSVELGGLGWRETVTAERTGWDVVGNETVYQVWLSSDDRSSTLAFESDPVDSETRVASYGFTVESSDGTFSISAREDNETVDSKAVPDDGESVELEGVSIVRDGGDLFAEHDGTSVVIATVETYN